MMPPWSDDSETSLQVSQAITQNNVRYILEPVDYGYICTAQEYAPETNLWYTSQCVVQGDIDACLYFVKAHMFKHYLKVSSPDPLANGNGTEH